MLNLLTISHALLMRKFTCKLKRSTDIEWKLLFLFCGKKNTEKKVYAKNREFLRVRMYSKHQARAHTKKRVKANKRETAP